MLMAWMSERTVLNGRGAFLLMLHLFLFFLFVASIEFAVCGVLENSR